MAVFSTVSWPFCVPTKTNRICPVKIVAPLTETNDFELFSDAGADEFYCGFVPFEWLSKFHSLVPLNRRESFSQTSIHDWTSVRILFRKAERYGKQINITFNAHYYLKEAYPILADILERLWDIGCQNIIVADPGLLLFLSRHHHPFSIHISGELPVYNECALDILKQFNVRRVIFPRKIRIEDMKDIINHQERGLEFESFVLNTYCLFSGGFCNSLHLSGYDHLCRIPRQLVRFDNDQDCIERDVQYNMHVKGTTPCRSKRKVPIQQHHAFGSDGCGICRIKELYESGVSFLKIVGRGFPQEQIIRDIHNTAKAISLIHESDDIPDFRRKIQDLFFSGNCKNIKCKCYYYEPSA